MSDIRSVFVITSNPIHKGELGTCEQGWFVRDGDTITMTSADGVPVCDGDTGGRVTHRLAPGEHEKDVAKRLTLRMHRATQRDDIGFNRPLGNRAYPKMVF